jgi:hypothetical protein
MLYCQVNGAFVNANNAAKVIKVFWPSSNAILVLHTNLWLQYINGKLKVDFKLDTMSKPKPVARLDNLLLLLVQYWACNKLVFPTKDNCLDIAIIMLF